MSVTITWYHKSEDIVLYTLRDGWTLEAVIEAKELFEAPLSHQPGYFIVDMLDVTSVPSGLLAESRQILKHFNTRGVLTVIVSKNRMVRWMVALLKRMGLEGEFDFADSLDAAHVIIRQHQEQKAG
jgi:hypothetical protein